MKAAALARFGNLQRALDRDGCLKINTQLELDIQLHPEDDTMLVDLKDAFQMFDRKKAAEEILRYVPGIYKCWRRFADQRQPTITVIPTNDIKKPLSLPVVTGDGQGALMGSLGFSLAYHPTVEKLNEISRFTAAYCDDTSLRDKTEQLILALDCLKDAKTGGFILGPAKTIVLLGIKGTYSAALDAVQQYINAGLPAKNICVHPLDAPEALLARITQLYGAKSLGRPIGSAEFQSAWFFDKIKVLAEEGAKIARYSNKQQAFHLLVKSFSQKATHLARQMDSSKGTPLRWFLDNLDSLMKLTMCEGILGVTYETVMQSTTAVKLLQMKAGLGLRSQVASASSAYLAAMSRILPVIAATAGDDVANSIRNVDPALARDQELLRDLPDSAMQVIVWKMLKDYNKRVEEKVGNRPLLSETYNEQEAAGRQKVLWKPVEQKRYDDLIKSGNLSIETLMMIRGNSDAAVGNKFLTVLPSRGLERLTLDNQTFRVACLSLLGVPLGKGEGVEHYGEGVQKPVLSTSGPLWGTQNLRCSCVKRTLLEPNLHHIAACGTGYINKGDGACRVKFHNGIRDWLDKLRHDSGLFGGKELPLPTVEGKTRKDGDIYIDNINLPGLPNTFGRLLSDVQITHPASKMKSLSEAKIVDIAKNKKLFYKQLHLSDKSKVNDAEPHTTAAGYDYCSFILDWFGGSHTSARKLLRGICEIGERSGYWSTRMQGANYGFKCVELSCEIARIRSRIIMEYVKIHGNLVSIWVDDESAYKSVQAWATMEHVQ